jgi:hypothetical protein
MTEMRRAFGGRVVIASHPERARRSSWPPERRISRLRRVTGATNAARRPAARFLQGGPHAPPCCSLRRRQAEESCSRCSRGRAPRPRRPGVTGSARRLSASGSSSSLMAAAADLNKTEARTASARAVTQLAPLALRAHVTNWGTAKPDPRASTNECVRRTLTRDTSIPGHQPRTDSCRRTRLPRSGGGPRRPGSRGRAPAPPRGAPRPTHEVHPGVDEGWTPVVDQELVEGDARVGQERRNSVDPAHELVDLGCGAACAHAPPLRRPRERSSRVPPARRRAV